MKKILILVACALTILSLSGCSKGDSNKVDEPTKTVQLYKGSYSELFDDETRVGIENIYGYSDDMFLKEIGKDFPVKTFTDYYGNEVTLDDGPMVFEVVGSWCTYCQKLSKEVMDGLVEAYPDIKFYQYFSYGTAPDIDQFYQTIEKELPENMVILQNNQEFDTWLNNNGYSSVPLVLTTDNTGKMSLSFLGYNDLASYKNFVGYVMNNSLSNKTTTNGVKFSDFVKEQEVAKKYIENLSEIDVPESLFN